MTRNCIYALAILSSFSATTLANVVVEEFEISPTGLLGDRLEVGNDLAGGGGPVAIVAPPYDSNGFRYAYFDGNSPAAIIDTVSDLELVGQSPGSDYMGFDARGRLEITKLDGSSFRLVSLDFGPTLGFGQTLQPGDDVSLLLSYDLASGGSNSLTTSSTSSMTSFSAASAGITNLALTSLTLRQSNSTPFVGIDNVSFNVSAVPEPNSIFALGVMAGAVCYRRKRNPSDNRAIMGF